jgi:hypothetical protein
MLGDKYTPKAETLQEELQLGTGNGNPTKLFGVGVNSGGAIVSGNAACKKELSESINSLLV